MRFEVAPSFQFHSPTSEIEASRKPYESILQFMFGSNIGVPLTDAFKAFKIPIPDGEVASLPLSFLQFYTKLRRQHTPDGRYFNTYKYDWETSKCSSRNNKCNPRMGSYALVSGLGDKEILVRIGVSFIFVKMRRIAVY